MNKSEKTSQGGASDPSKRSAGQSRSSMKEDKASDRDARDADDEDINH